MKASLGILLLLAAALPAMAQADLNLWNFATAKIAGDGRVVGTGTGGRNFSSTDPAITLVDDAESPGGKALAFSGEQQKSPSVGTFYERPGPIMVKLTANPTPNTGGNEQTILAHPGVYELRYNRIRGDLTAYFPQKDNQQIVSLRVPLAGGKWSKVELRAKDREATLTVDDQTSTLTFPEGASLQSSKAYARLGMMVSGRPFTGMIADLSIGDPAE